MDMALWQERGNDRQRSWRSTHLGGMLEEKSGQGQSIGGCFHDGKAGALVLRSGGAKIQNIKICNLLRNT